MDSGYSPGQSGGRRGGFALLIVLAAVAIMLILYAAQLGTWPGSTPSRQKPAEPEPVPWDEEDRLVGPGEEIAEPREGQVRIAEVVELAGPVWRGQQRRGRIEVIVRPNGEVDGVWGCRYEHGDTQYSIEAQFLGNIDPSKVYEGPGGEQDESKLFFITKGTYLQKRRIERGSISSEEGIVYVTGWVEPGFSAFGEIVITTDKSWHGRYQWQAEM